jgi:hypothetical protein
MHMPKVKQMDTEQVRSKIAEGIKIATIKKGFTLVAEDWGMDRFNCSCPLGCILASNDIPISSDEINNMVAIEHVLGVSQQWMTSFIRGFDDSPPDPDVIKEAFKLGKEFRDEYKPVNFEVYYNMWMQNHDD